MCCAKRVCFDGSRSRVLIMDAESKYWAIDLTSNYAFKPIAEQALRPNETVVPQRLNAALGVNRSHALA